MKYNRVIVLTVLIIILFFFIFFLHLFSSKTPTSWAVMNEKGGLLCASEMRKGVTKLTNKETMINTDKNAIVVLTRGYNNNGEYGKLVKRNNAIYDNYYKNIENKNMYDVVIFHEGNITEEQQVYIQSQTPDLPLLFQKVDFLNINVNNPMCHQSELSNNFGNGYKNMCYFWSISFLQYLKNYKYIFRIYEDCYIDNIRPDLVEEYEKNNIMYAFSFDNGYDVGDVTKGMEDLFNEYIKKNNLPQTNNKMVFPYTNLMIINIPYFSNNEVVMGVLNEIQKSECIFSNRWGDLPIWGYILSLLVDKQYYLLDDTIKYYHESHGVKI